ncbi:MAG TPA: beta-N-acetylhexosaminidase [Ferruginibacter sp.]|nr:beta-N-acetylhexosaminidase [Ferruginibacter sp.]
MTKRLILWIALLNAGFSQAQDINIFPRPQSVKAGKQTFNISATTVIVLQGSGLETSSAFLNSYLQQFYGFSLKTASTNTAGSNAIILNYEKMDNKIAGAYKMEVTNKGVYIAGDNKEGVFYGIQSLIQLLPAEKNTSLPIPQVAIQDAPRFAYRGLHLDVSRNFMPLDFVKKYIDYIALFKMNTFHWHLTDDQGWRIEIKKYPKLTEVGAWRDGTIIGHYPGTGNDNIHTGGFYTQEEIKEVVRYAADRMITVIPEIEMPGHASAAIAAYPYLICFPDQKTELKSEFSKAAVQKQANGQNKIVQETWGVFEDVFTPTEETFTFLLDVRDEVMVLFPSEYLHVGGDECPKEAWKKSAFCQQLIKEKGLKDEHGLQSYFIQRMEKYLNSKGRKIIGWDEILEGGLAPNATVMSWRGEAGGIEAAKQHHDVVMTPGSHVYLDHGEGKNEDSLNIGGYLPLDTVYSYDPQPAALSKDELKYILGAQGNVWTEYLRTPAKVEYMILPRLAALSEVLWTNKTNKNWDDFLKRMPELQKRLEFMQVNYNRKSFVRGK